MNSSKTILITGCSSGFGLLMTARLSSKGHTCIATMRTLKKQGPLLSEVSKRGGSADVKELDVTKPQTIAKTIAHISKTYGYLDVLINNAGFGLGGFFEDLSQDEIREQMETNFFGVQNVTRACIPLMRNRKGSKIINISSVSGLYATPSFGAYNASKWALEGFSESLKYELGLFGIGVHLIEPGAYRTEIFESNARYAKNFNNEESPYFEASQFFYNRVRNYLDDNHKDPEDVAALAEKIILANNPPFRNIPDIESQVLLCFRRFLPFRLYSWVLNKILFKNLSRVKKS